MHSIRSVISIPATASTKCKDGANRKLQGINQLEGAEILKFQEFLSDKEKHL